ncbi:MAG: hypothetical protein ACREBR_04485 [bacterium]
MKFFSKKELKAAKAICPNCGEMKSTSATSKQIEEGDWECSECFNRSGRAREEERLQDRGKKEISKYDIEYEFLVKLVRLVVKEGVNPEEIRALAEAYPFQTVDDVVALTQQIFDLAAKYQIPREWLAKKLPRTIASLKTAGQVTELFQTRVFINPNENQILNVLEKSEFNGLRYLLDKQGNTYVWDASAAVHEDMGRGLGLSDATVKDAGYIENPADAKLIGKKADLWPAQEEADDMLDHAPGYLAYEYGQDKESKSKKQLNINDIVEILNKKDPKVVRIDMALHALELADGTVLPFEDAAKRVMDMGKEGGFSGAEFSTTDFGVNPTVDNGPFSSPEDHGAKPQKSPFPNTNWLPADDENKDEQPASNVAARLNRPFSKKAFFKISKHESGYVDNGVGYTCGRCVYFGNGHCALVQGDIKAFGCCNLWSDKATLKTDGEGTTKKEAGYIEFKGVDYRCDECVFFDAKVKTCMKVEGKISPTASCNLWGPIKKESVDKQANPNMRYWIAPDGTEFPVHGVHSQWITHNLKTLSKYGLDINDSLSGIWNQMIHDGWTRVSNEPAGTGFTIEVNDINNIQGYLDNFIAKNFRDGNVIAVGNGQGQWARTGDPFPSIQKAIQKELRNPVNASLKQADISGKVVNDILQGIHSDGGITYNLNTGNMAGTDNYSVSIYPDRAVILSGVDFDAVENFITSNEDLLNDPLNSFGAWTHDGKVYLDVVATVPDLNQAVELGQRNNKIAVWDLKNNEQISTCGTGEPTKAANKTAEEQALTQIDQDAIAAASSSSVYNIAINNYAEAVKRGHDKDRALQYAVESVQNLDKIDEKKLVELINNYL